MGSNYFLINKKDDKRIHLGKSSLGWQFCFRENKEYNPTMNDLFKYVEKDINNEIWCDYGKITLTKFKKIIKDHLFGDNIITYAAKHPNYYVQKDIDFISSDGSWWCKVDFS